MANEQEEAYKEIAGALLGGIVPTCYYAAVAVYTYKPVLLETYRLVLLGRVPEQTKHLVVLTLGELRGHEAAVVTIIEHAWGQMSSDLLRVAAARVLRRNSSPTANDLRRKLLQSELTPIVRTELGFPKKKPSSRGRRNTPSNNTNPSPLDGARKSPI
jgi:hypothetical protein